MVSCHTTLLDNAKLQIEIGNIVCYIPLSVCLAANPLFRFLF